MLWGREAGLSLVLRSAWRRSSGFEHHRLAPLWNRSARCCSATASTSTTSRACASSRTSSIRSGSRATSPRRVACHADRARTRRRARQRRRGRRRQAAADVLAAAEDRRERAAPPSRHCAESRAREDSCRRRTRSRRPSVPSAVAWTLLQNRAWTSVGRAAAAVDCVWYRRDVVHERRKVVGGRRVHVGAEVGPVDQLVEPDVDIPSRDLFYGVGGRSSRPAPTPHTASSRRTRAG